MQFVQVWCSDYLAYWYVHVFLQKCVFICKRFTVFTFKCNACLTKFWIFTKLCIDNVPTIQKSIKGILCVQELKLLPGSFQSSLFKKFKLHIWKIDNYLKLPLSIIDIYQIQVYVLNKKWNVHQKVVRHTLKTCYEYEIFT